MSDANAGKPVAASQAGSCENHCRGGKNFTRSVFLLCDEPIAGDRRSVRETKGRWGGAQQNGGEEKPENFSRESPGNHARKPIIRLMYCVLCVRATTRVPGTTTGGLTGSDPRGLLNASAAAVATTSAGDFEKRGHRSRGRARMPRDGRPPRLRTSPRANRARYHRPRPPVRRERFARAATLTKPATIIH